MAFIRDLNSSFDPNALELLEKMLTLDPAQVYITLSLSGPIY
jgi:hypothetical protein